ncbi:ABC transporter ATP-binding protein [Pseudonocardia acidicola]|uniref:ABC transporter ATP-binding protein n=1 Tax=Pseudonocardia acidicola TaxID=2724939 RepID=A0ABX1S9M7_9PSEU|nr:ABC transporter ATP-binding protein [Pseudonocardia acidicola]NMH96868.1 ABC transporter ATP-binding protein [Pseudonocardia acidicola]
MPDLLDIADLHVLHGKVRALRGVGLSVRPGEIVALIGANGAGKTTTLRAVSGLVRARRGRIRFDGRDISRVPGHRIVGMGLSHVPERRRIFPAMTVMENLRLGGFLRGRRDRTLAADLDRVLELFPRLAERAGQVGGTLSGGEQQMLAIGRALMSKPRMLLLDEPSMGLAPLMVEQIFRIIAEINAQGVTVLLVEQNAAQALAMAHRAYVLEGGRVVHSGAGRDLLHDDAVRRSYLGVKAAV